MTLEQVLQDIHAMREDLLVFERKYGLPTEVFYDAYLRGEEPADSAWVLDWSEWATTYEILQDRLNRYTDTIRHLLASTTFSQIVERTARHEPVAIAA
jgi:hypothetical protein